MNGTNKFLHICENKYQIDTFYCYNGTTDFLKTTTTKIAQGRWYLKPRRL